MSGLLEMTHSAQPQSGRATTGEAPSRAPMGSAERPARVVIVGAGISGLAAAHRLRELDTAIEVTVLESSGQPGGVLRTDVQDGYLIEASADSFITTYPWGIDLCRRLGLTDRLIETDASRRRAFVVCRGRLERIPDGLLVMAPTRLMPMARTPILSWAGKLRTAAEVFVKPGSGRDESLASFARRRFGREAYERLIQPLVSGMYTGDPERLSVQATMPRFQQMEQSHGSLIRAMRPRGKAKGSEPAGSGARYSLFVGLREGMRELVAALVDRLPAGSIRCQMKVTALRPRSEGGWHVQIEPAAAAVARPETLDADAVILATPVKVASQLTQTIDPALAAMLGQITTTSSAIVSLGYRRDQVNDPLDGFGFVVPLRERLPILSGSFSSVKFVGRSPADRVLFRVFMGGASRPDLLDEPDEVLHRIAHEEMARLLQITGQPELRTVSRWRDAMPQYAVGHLDLVAAIRQKVASLPVGLAVTGNAFDGVGVPQCIHGGEEAAQRVLAALKTRGATLS